MKNYSTLAMRTNKPGDEIQLLKGQLRRLIPALEVYLFASNVLDKLKAEIVYGRGVEAAEYVEDNTVEASGRDKEILHAVLGLATEGGELAETLLKELTSQDCHLFGVMELELNAMNLVEEGGDLCWFQELLAHSIGTPIDTWKQRNIAKLQARFPGKYSDAKANSRDKEAESEALK